MFAKASALVALSLGLVLTCFSSFALAHEGGHGPTLEGYGPHGGKRAAVVSAADAGKGANAAVQAVAEWKLDNGVLTVHFWDKNLQRPLKASGDLTWVLLPAKNQASEQKPVVVRRNLQSGRSRLRLSEGLQHARAAEMIVGSLSGHEGKQVVFLNW